jgi:hypothetical protein
MGRSGVIIVGLVICELLVSGCSSGGPAAVKVTTESVRVGRFTEIFSTPLPATRPRPASSRGSGRA